MMIISLGENTMQSIVNSKKVSLVPFHWAHPHIMNLRPHHARLRQTLPGFDARMRYYQQEGAVTAIYDGVMACSFGAVKLWPGVAECWMITGYQVERAPITLTRSAMRYFDQTAIDMKLHRLQITVDRTNLLAMRWAYRLNFEQEGILRSYGHDKADHVIFAKVY